jgi:predicted Mrr-cat superfamily restriction endonuclease
MNYSTAVFLVNDKVRAIAVTYEADGYDADGRPTTIKAAARYTFKTFDQSIKKGDLVIVPTNTRHKFTICKVVDADLEIDFDADTELKWIAGVFEEDAYKRTLEQETVMLEAIKSAEKNRKREELRKSLMADSESKLLALPIAKVVDVE